MTDQPPTPTRTKRRRMIGLAAACVLVGGLAVALAVFLLRRAPPEADYTGHDVPLGVEEAVVIRYSGPPLVAQPYRRGASVNVRIAEEADRGPVRIYDVRYVVNVPGEFDLMDYLASADGTPIENLPSFKVRGLTRLTKDIETRIQEIEDVEINIWHWYYETLAGLGVLWALWLVGLVVIGRPKRPPKAPPPPPEPSLAEQIARYFEALARGDLDVADKARLEILLLRHWRERLNLQEDRMAAACRRMRRDEAVGRAYDALEAWLHNPSAQVGPADLSRLCTPLVNP